MLAAAMTVLIVPNADAQKKKLERNMQPVPRGDAGEWFPPNAYPPEALRAARQGRTVVRVGVDSVGKVVSCEVEVSSGTAVLDARTCELAFEHGSFNPGTDRKGLPAAGTYLLPVNWSLADDEQKPQVLPATDAIKFEENVAIELTVGADGKLIACRILAAKLRPDSNKDPCAFQRVGSQITPGWIRDGRQVGAKIIFRGSQSITVDP